LINNCFRSATAALLALLSDLTLTLVFSWASHSARLMLAWHVAFFLAFLAVGLTVFFRALAISFSFLPMPFRDFFTFLGLDALQVG